MLEALDDDDLKAFYEQFPEPPPREEDTVSFGNTPRAPILTERNKENIVKFDQAYEQIYKIITARQLSPEKEIDVDKPLTPSIKKEEVVISRTDQPELQQSGEAG